jgi:uncharacterized protein (TIGR00730 family)
MDPKLKVAVFGSSTLGSADPGYAMGEKLGAALARAGAIVVTGGYLGAMEAVSKGAVEAGGRAIGVTVELFERRGPANRYITQRIHTQDLHERLRWLVGHCHGFVVLPGSVGTLTELFLTWTLLATGGRPHAPLVLLGDHWPALLEALRHPDYIPEPLYHHVTVTQDVQEAARIAVKGVVSDAAPLG